MKDTEKTTKINRINKKAGELFDEIEDLALRTDRDEAAQVISEDLGDYLKKSEGFSILEYARDLSLTQSEISIMDLEEAAWHMNEEALKSIHELAEGADKLIKMIGSRDFNRRFFELQIEHLEGYISDVLRKTNIEYQSRAERYREELDELKKKAS